MLLPDPQFARSDILRIFNHAQIYLFLGASITTVGVLSACFSLLRRRFDPLLLWFALFAVLYGLRLEMNYQLLWAFGLRPAVFRRIVVAVGFLVPIPAFFFFRILNLLGLTGRIIAHIVWPVLLCLGILTLAVGNRDIFHTIDNTVVIAALVVVIIALVRIRSGSPDLALIRRGLFVFIAGALYDNLSSMFWRYYNIEPFCFVILLVCLGVVAARRTLANEQQLSVIQKELEIAKRIQLSILPLPFPASKSFRVTARYLPMTTVAGDFYDFLLTSDHEAGLLIADVSGHGIPAALIASMVKLAASTQSGDAERPSALLHGMNTTLCGNTQNQFVTAGYVYLNAQSQELRYSAAAHPPMLLVRNGEVIEIAENGLMLAAFDFATYTTLTLPIQTGDRLVLYTDGMVEATNIHQEEFGPDRLYDIVRATANLSDAEAADQIISSIQHWSATQNDDLTIILCDYTA